MISKTQGGLAGVGVGGGEGGGRGIREGGGRGGGGAHGRWSSAV